MFITSLLFKFISFERLRNSVLGSDVLLFLEFINIVSVLFYNFTECIILLYAFLVIYFARYRKYMNCLISFSKFSDVLPVFTSASAISNLWSVCLGVNILSPLPHSAFRLASATVEEQSLHNLKTASRNL